MFMINGCEVAAAAVIDLRLVHNCGPEVTTQALAEMFYILVNDKHIIELVAAEGVVRKLLLLRRYCARMNLIETDYVLRRPWKVRTYVGRWVNGWMNGWVRSHVGTVRTMVVGGFGGRKQALSLIHI